MQLLWRDTNLIVCISDDIRTVANPARGRNKFQARFIYGVCLSILRSKDASFSQPSVVVVVHMQVGNVHARSSEEKVGCTATLGAL